MEFSLPLLLLIGSVATISVTLGLFAMYLFGSFSVLVTPKSSIFSGQETRPVFLFDGGDLIDASPPARRILSRVVGSGAAWEGLMDFLVARFPTLADELEGLGQSGQITLTSPWDEVNPMALHATRENGLLRLILSDADTLAHQGYDPLTIRAIEDELERLRRINGLIPYPVWREDPQGRVIWANQAYLTHLCTISPTGISWPLPRLFPPTPQGETEYRARLEPTTGMDTAKIALPEWFDIRSHPEDTGETLYFATPADAAVSDEKSLREFMQTLTKTFAHLPIGLAVFDRQRQLALFNPALADLSGLRVDFLSMKPTLYAFLDQMRENRMIPEPKDYRTWRRQMAEIEKASSAGQFQETWNLPGDRIYRVTGRPHPKGAMALMFEDITTEMTRARLFRANIELSQAVLDTVDEAIAVFSETGVLVMSNHAYSGIWQHDPSDALGAGAIGGMAALWQARSTPTEVWAHVEEAVMDRNNREEWFSSVRLLDGRLIACHVRPLPAGATMVAFRLPDRVDKITPPQPLPEERQTA